ncbi:MAG: hypothetical protein Q4D77_01445 [Peptostreptococcaceae bacterium]|nr:hypothetical protein [Peptostreptococcaceae bacterium]
MRKSIKAGILFIALVSIFLTIPTIRRITTLQRAIDKSEFSKNVVEIPTNDSYKINLKLDEMIEASHLKKESLSFYTQAQEGIKLLEYQMMLSGSLQDVIGFVDDLSRFPGIELRLIELERSALITKAEIHAVFIGESR